MEHLNQLKKLLESGHRLITIETEQVDHVCDLLLELGRFSAKPYYIASPQQAMYRVGVSHIGIPRTQTNSGLIQHIAASKHFGGYILCDYADILESNEAVKLLTHIATAETHKVVIMVAKSFTIPEKLKPFVVRSKHKKKNTG